MLHTKFRGNLSTGSGEDFCRVFTIYGRGGHLGHVVVVVLRFYISPTAKVIRRRDLGSKSHPKDCLGHVTSIMSSDFHFLVPESFHKYETLCPQQMLVHKGGQIKN